MHEVVDLYAKLLIGTFSFIGPAFTLLIPLFYEAILKSQHKHSEKLVNLQLIIRKQMQQDLLTGLKSTTRDLKKMIAANERELNLLNPKRQVKRLFFTLLPAIILVLFYYFQKSSFWPYKYQSIRVITIGLSLSSFACCLIVLWQIFCTIIKIKLEEKQQRQQETVVGRFRLKPHPPTPPNPTTTQ